MFHSSLILQCLSKRGFLRSLIIGNVFDSFAFKAIQSFHITGTSSSGKMAFTGHSLKQSLQLMHMSGSMTK
ncbi:hypothetical protein LEP1GSC178_2199 [Leptospira licerasiae str. MMD4847]|uniref:Uncharacterized protein n=1 Tax=Leptospira licerasiae str. MMD4847 TaxID=1049971 RepID=A0ABN0HE27_9LEPT|nr:hypothetical protein LEP1GSC178_2199 [Leptospira licerasiae str. MMD4847]